jgi:photosystem II stability/assembly factor-like uncharacterized protein
MTELLVGTRKGLFILGGDAEEPFAIATRAFVGDPVDYAMREPTTGRLFVAVTSPFWGPRIWFTDDLASGDWQAARGVSLPRGGDAALKRIWAIVASDDGSRLWAGGDPGVLFESRDGGENWELNRALFEHPTRPRWKPDSGGLSVHSIAPWPGDPDRLALAISAAGIWLTDDGGVTWRHGNAGIVADYLPEQGRETAIDLCVHHIERAPARPERLFMQFHGGVYRSDDAGESWNDIAAGLPSDFGFPVALDPADPDSAYVVPVATEDRVTPGGKVLVWETRDAGATWTPRGDGLPERDAYLQILRQSFDRAGAGDALELYFGTTSGEIFGSRDAGRRWFEVARRLPAIASLRVGC